MVWIGREGVWEDEGMCRAEEIVSLSLLVGSHDLVKVRLTFGNVR